MIPIIHRQTMLTRAFSFYLQIVQLDCRNQSHLSTKYFFLRVPSQVQTHIPVIKVFGNWSSLCSLIFGENSQKFACMT